MSLVLTRRPGQAIVVFTPDGGRRRLYVVSVEGDVVRLAIDAPADVKIVREELLPRDGPPWWKAGPDVIAKVAGILCATYALDRLATL